MEPCPTDRSTITASSFTNKERQLSTLLAPIMTPVTNGEVGVGGGEPVVHFDVNRRHGLGHKAVQVVPRVVLEDLEDEFRTFLDQPVSPTGLITLDPGFEGHQIEQSAPTESHIGEPRRPTVHDGNNKWLSGRGPPSGPTRTRASIGTTSVKPIDRHAAARRRLCSKQ